MSGPALRRFRGVLAGTDGTEILINVDEGTLGLDFSWLTDAKLVMTDELVREMLRARKAAHVEDGQYDEIEADGRPDEE